MKASQPLVALAGTGEVVMIWLRSINKVKYDLMVLLAILGYATYYYIEVRSLSAQTINLLLIEPVYWLLFVSVLALIGNNIRRARQAVKSSTDSEQVSSATPDNGMPSEFLKRGLWFGIMTVLYVLGLDTLGFVSSSFLYLACLTYLLGARSIWVSVVLPAVVVGFLYVSMVVFLRFSLPDGILI